MNNQKRPKNIVSLILNVVLFAFVLVAIGTSLYVVFGEDAGAVFDQDEVPVTADQDLAEDELPLIEAAETPTPTIDIPADEHLIRKEFLLVDSLLVNPGIGWIYRWSGRRASEIPATVAYGERSDVSWRVLNPGEDKYNWAPLDAQMQEAVSAGQQYSFRVYTMIGESFGGHQVPQWVIDNGALILESGEPDYSNCVYQDAWGRFVNELVKRYDGNPNIAFIDISGYGDFNEWSWGDQTEWDYSWEDHYNDGTASKNTFSTLDSQARRRLADMFIGGEFADHSCQTEIKSRKYVSYDYPGFQETQLVMPYGGVIQATQYVFTQRKDVGFRHDCLGRVSSEHIPERLGFELGVIHQQAPIVFETCSEREFEMASAFRQLSNVPASLIHNANLHNIETEEIAGLSKNLGYRYYLSGITHESHAAAGELFYLKMDWSNLGNSPNYPAMGQDFQLHVYLVPQEGGETLDVSLNTEITSWLPSDQPGISLPGETEVEKEFSLSEGMEPGIYDLRVAIIELRTGDSILLANDGRGSDGWYQISEVVITGE